MKHNKEIRLLMGIPSKKIKMGGPTTHLSYLVDFFNKNNQYRIITFNYGSKIDQGSLINTTESIFRKLINTIRVFILFVYQVSFFRPHIIHINTAFDKKSLIRDIPFSLFSFVFRKKLIFKIHGSSYELVKTDNKIYLFLIKLFFLGAKKVGVLSDIEKTEFITKFGNAKKLEVVKNIINEPKLENIDNVVFFTKDPKKIYGLFISRIIKGKGLEDIIHALPFILNEIPGFSLVVAGTGPEKDICMDLARELNVNDSIIWLGFVQNNHIPSLFSYSDIYLFLSHLPEGMPMSLVEGLSCRIPIISTRNRFAVNYLQNNKNCLFVESGNINDIYGKIINLLDNKDLQTKMKTTNPEIVKRFRPEIVGNEFDRIYKQLLKRDIK